MLRYFCYKLCLSMHPVSVCPLSAHLTSCGDDKDGPSMGWLVAP